MAKVTGIGWTTFSVDDSGGTARAIVNDINSAQFSTPRGVQDMTGMDSSAIERDLLLADFTVALTLFLNTASNRAHDVFKTVPSTSVARTVTITHSGVTLACETLFSDYGLSRSAGGELTCTTNGALSDGTVPTWA